MMLERLFFKVIEDGITFLKANPTAIEKLFGEDALLDSTDKETEPTKISELFAAQPPSVQHSFPRKDSVFPCYCITLASDAVSQQFLADDGGFIGDIDDEDAGGFRMAEVRAYNYVILIFAQHPDYVLYLYHLLVWMLHEAKPVLVEQGLMDVKMSGADVVPQAQTMPAGLFVRRLTVSCEREYAQVPSSTKLPTVAFKVAGIHWDSPSAGDPGADTGDVVGRVTTPFDEGDDDDEEDGFLGG